MTRMEYAGGENVTGRGICAGGRSRDSVASLWIVRLQWTGGGEILRKRILHWLPPVVRDLHRSVSGRQSVHYEEIKPIPLQALRFPGGWGSQTPRQSVHEGGKVVSPTHRPLLPPRKYSWYSFLLKATERIMSMKNSSDTIGNQTRDLPVCSAVHKPIAPPRPRLWRETLGLEDGDWEERVLWELKVANTWSDEVKGRNNNMFSTDVVTLSGDEWSASRSGRFNPVLIRYGAGRTP
jgi:hypothetical protein